MTVLSKVKINKILNDDQVEKLTKSINNDYLTPFMRKYFNQTNTKNYVLDSNVMEYLISSILLNGKNIGSGNYPIDVIMKNLDNVIEGIDVGCICFSKKNLSNEKSLHQNFKLGNLDKLFEEGDFESILTIFKKKLFDKLNFVKNKHNIKNLYYLNFLTDKNNIYLSIFEININKIENIKIGKKNKKSFQIENFISNNLGQLKLYKSKTRLEIRFKRDILKNPNVVKLI